MNPKESGLQVNKLDDEVQKLRIIVQNQADRSIKKPLAILGDQSRRVEVGSFPEIPKDLRDPD
jgi:hypothetical protein